jgi:hypothetical protein
MKTEDRKKLASKTRKKGKELEKEVQRDLEKRGWVVIKFNKNIDLNGPIPNEGRLIDCKPFFFGGRIQMMSGGFPDFLCFLKIPLYTPEGIESLPAFHLQLVESKISGKLDKIEKDKCKWIEENLHIPIFIATKEGKEIVYKSYKAERGETTK